MAKKGYRKLTAQERWQVQTIIAAHSKAGTATLSDDDLAGVVRKQLGATFGHVKADHIMYARQAMGMKPLRGSKENGVPAGDVQGAILRELRAIRRLLEPKKDKAAS